MTTSEPNPGRAVFTLGALCVAFQGIGMATMVPQGSGTPPTQALVGLAITFGLTVFIASIVGAYYAGRKKR